MNNKMEVFRRFCVVMCCVIVLFNIGWFIDEGVFGNVLDAIFSKDTYYKVYPYVFNVMAVFILTPLIPMVFYGAVKYIAGGNKREAQ